MRTLKALAPYYYQQRALGHSTQEVGKLKQIVVYLDKLCSEMDALISEKESLVSDLEVYKRSLVFETVTGKRKVV